MTDCKTTPVQLGKQTIALVDCDPNKGGLSLQSPDDAVYVNSDYAVIRQSPAEFFKSVGLNPELPYSTAKLVRLLEKLDQLVKLLDPAGRDYTLDGWGKPIAFSTQMASFRLICQDTSEYWQSRYQPELCPQTTGAILATLIPQAQAHTWAEAHVASVEEALAPYFRGADPVDFRLSHADLALKMDLAVSAAAFLYPLADLPTAQHLVAAKRQWDSYTQALTSWETEVTKDIHHLEELSRKAANAIIALKPESYKVYPADAFLEKQASLQRDRSAAKAPVADYQAALTQFRQKHPALVGQFDVWDKTDFQHCYGSHFGEGGSCNYQFPHPLYGAYFYARGRDNPTTDIDALTQQSWVMYCDTDGIGDGCPWTGDQVTLPPLISLVSPGMVR